MRDLIVEPEAEEELAAALDWYDEQEPGLVISAATAR